MTKKLTIYSLILVWQAFKVAYKGRYVPGVNDLETNDCGVVVDDCLVGCADVVAVLEDAAQHFAGDAIHPQAHGGFGEWAQDACHGLVHDAVHPSDEFLDELAVVVAALVALGEGEVGTCDRCLQVLKQ